MTTELDRALAQLKRIRKCHYESSFTSGYELGVDHAIQIIERLGGLSPEQRAAEEGDLNTPVTGPWPRPSDHKQAGRSPTAADGDVPMPITTLAALNGDDTPPDPEAA